MISAKQHTARRNLQKVLVIYDEFAHFKLKYANEAYLLLKCHDWLKAQQSHSRLRVTNLTENQRK